MSTYEQDVTHCATLTPKTQVRLRDDDGEDNPIKWGTVVRATEQELDSLGRAGVDPEVTVMVLWSPGRYRSKEYRRWEYAEDLVARKS